jgi:hypothetical protein
VSCCRGAAGGADAKSRPAGAGGGEPRGVWRRRPPVFCVSRLGGDAPRRTPAQAPGRGHPPRVILVLCLLHPCCRLPVQHARQTKPRDCDLAQCNGGNAWLTALRVQASAVMSAAARAWCLSQNTASLQELRCSSGHMELRRSSGHTVSACIADAGPRHAVAAGLCAGSGMADRRRRRLESPLRPRCLFRAAFPAYSLLGLECCGPMSAHVHPQQAASSGCTLLIE